MGIVLILQGVSAQTWVITKRLSYISQHVAQTPRAAIANVFNNMYVVWHSDHHGNYEIYFKKSEDGGISWTGKRLTYNSSWSDYPDIAVDSSNNLHVVWTDLTPSDVLYKKSTDGGTTWSTKRLTWTSGPSYKPAIEIGSDDHIHVVWHDFTPNAVYSEIYYKRSTDGGVTWPFTKRLTWSLGDSFQPQVAIDSNNNIHVTWFDNASDPGNWDEYEVYYKKSTDRGDTWTASKRLTWATKEFRFPNITVDDSDNIHIAWQESKGLGEVYYKKSGDNGNTWTGAKRLTWESGSFWPSRYPDVASDSSGNIFVIYQHQVPKGAHPNPNVEIFFRKSTDGGNSWVPPKRLTWREELSYYAKTVVDSGDSIHIVWTDDRTGNWEIFYKKGIQ